MLIDLWKARIPMIGIRTDDLVYIDEVLTEILGVKFRVINSKDVPSSMPNERSSNMLVLDGGKEIKLTQFPKLYKEAIEHHARFIFVNPLELPLANGGTIHPPQNMLKRLLKLQNNQDCLNALAGLSLKDAREVLKIAGVGVNLDQRILKTRQMIRSGVLGVSLLNTEQPFYIQDKKLCGWVSSIAEWVQSVNPYLQPRGLLLKGPAGVGKTEASKYIARTLGICLYRLDIAMIMDKFVGESERNLFNALSFLTHEAPCVVLIDEVEKLFKSKEDEGVSSQLLGQLLWWLQVHESSTITIMTCNDFESIPVELYREGRIDQVMKLEPLQAKYLPVFIYAFCEKGLQVKSHQAHIQTRIIINNIVEQSIRLLEGKKEITQAHAISAAVTVARKLLGEEK